MIAVLHYSVFLVISALSFVVADISGFIYLVHSPIHTFTFPRLIKPLLVWPRVFGGVCQTIYCPSLGKFLNGKESIILLRHYIFTIAEIFWKFVQQLDVINWVMQGTKYTVFFIPSWDSIIFSARNFSCFLKSLLFSLMSSYWMAASEMNFRICSLFSRLIDLDTQIIYVNGFQTMPLQFYWQLKQYKQNPIFLTEVLYWRNNIMHYTEAICINNQIRLHE